MTKIVRFILLNRALRYLIDITMDEVNKNSKKVNSRLVVAFVEVYYSIFVIIVWTFGLLPCMFLLVRMSPYVLEIVVRLVLAFILLVIFILILNKDFLNGRGVIHRLFGYQVTDIKTGLAATPLKCLVRNFTAVLMPFEILFLILNKERRVGDFIAGTIVVKTSPSNLKDVFQEFENLKLDRKGVLTLLISIIATFLYLLWVFTEIL